MAYVAIIDIAAFDNHTCGASILQYSRFESCTQLQTIRSFLLSFLLAVPPRALLLRTTAASLERAYTLVSCSTSLDKDNTHYNPIRLPLTVQLTIANGFPALKMPSFLKDLRRRSRVN